MAKLASIRVVRLIEPIEGADLIEKVWVDGWSLVVKKGEFDVGDVGLYMEVDTCIPLNRESFAFLQPRGSKLIGNGYYHRLKTIKLKNTLSQGLLLPLDVLGAENIPFTYSDFDKDFGEELGLFRYDPDIHGPVVSIPAQAAGRFPDYIPKTDQPRLQNELHLLQSEEFFEVTMKLEGSSLTIYRNLNDEKFPTGICSRNLRLKYPDFDKWYAEYIVDKPEQDIRHKSFLQREYMKDKLEKKELSSHFLQVGALYLDTLCAYCDKYNRNLALQMECMGPNIQGNIEGFVEFKGFLFDIYDIDNQYYLTPTERAELARQLNIPQAPVLIDVFKVKGNTLNDMLQLANGKSINAKRREGVVLKSHTRDGYNRVTSFKIINNEYLLHQKD